MVREMSKCEGCSCNVGISSTQIFIAWQACPRWISRGSGDRESQSLIAEGLLSTKPTKVFLQVEVSRGSHKVVRTIWKVVLG
jgi:hypothetical protein